MSKKIEIQNIGQIAIAVSDIKKAVEFYKDKLGLALLFEAPPGLAFRLRWCAPNGNHAAGRGKRP